MQRTYRFCSSVLPLLILCTRTMSQSSRRRRILVLGMTGNPIRDGRVHLPGANGKSKTLIRSERQNYSVLQS